jgi:hypothetical protein
MAMKVDNWDIVRDFRAARARLRLGPYERYLAEHIAGRVALLLGKRDESDRGGDNPGDRQQAGGRAVSPDSAHARRARTNRLVEATAVAVE